MEKRDYLVNLLSSGDQIANSILIEAINTAEESSINLAYDAAIQSSSSKKVIYLLGGNNPINCPFK